MHKNISDNKKIPIAIFEDLKTKETDDQLAVDETEDGIPELKRKKKKNRRKKNRKRKCKCECHAADAPKELIDACQCCIDPEPKEQVKVQSVDLVDDDCAQDDK